MKRIGLAAFYGFVTWFVALAVSMAVYPLKKSGDPLFETVMTLTVGTLAVLATVLYFRGVHRRFVLEGLELGLVILAVNLLLDLPMFMYGPMAMPLGAYIRDIGLTYGLYPLVTVGGSLVASTAAARAREEPLAVAPTPLDAAEAEDVAALGTAAVTAAPEQSPAPAEGEVPTELPVA